MDKVEEKTDCNRHSEPKVNRQKPMIEYQRIL